MKRIIALLALALGLSATSVAQEALEPKSSPLDQTYANFGDSYVKIVYSRPSKRDREIFGDLVPFDKVWRTGANAATEITTTGDITIGGQELPAGTYSLYTIPTEDSWTIIINSDLGQWGAYRYNEENDVLRFTVKTEETSETYEPFTIKLDGEEGKLYMMWDDTQVSIPIKG